MCMGSACGLLYKRNFRVEELACTCDYGYWDLFQETFIERRKRKLNEDNAALPMKKKHEEIRHNLSTDEFEARMRYNFILHGMSCNVDDAIPRGRSEKYFGEDNLLRAMCELQEVTLGDFKSRGTSGLLLESLQIQANRSSTTGSTKEQEAAGRSRSKPSHGLDIRQRVGLQERNDSGEEPQSRERNPRINDRRYSSTDNRAETLIASSPRPGLSPARSQIQYNPNDRHARVSRHVASKAAEPIRTEKRTLIDYRHGPQSQDDDDDYVFDERVESRTTKRTISEGRSLTNTDRRPHMSSTGEAKPVDTKERSFEQSLPKDGIAFKILQHHQTKQTFGRWLDIREVSEGGRPFYLIAIARGSSKLDEADIERLKEDSSIYLGHLRDVLKDEGK